MSDSHIISMLLVDDQAIVRAAFKSLLERVSHFRVVGDVGDARSAIELASRLRPDIVLLDITMPGLSGIDAVAPLKRGSPKSRVLMASQHEGQKFVAQALMAGADGYLSKDSEPAELALAIEAIHSGDSYLSPKVAGSAMTDAVYAAEAIGQGALSQLTAREREVFQLLAVGNSNKQVAATLHLSIGTIKKHRENLQRKLDCHSAAELARLAIREGLLSV